MFRNFMKIAVIGILLAGSWSCASFNKSATTKTMEYESRVDRGGVESILVQMEQKARKGGRDGVALALQAGSYSFFAKNYPKSIEMFNLAESYIKDFEQRAAVTARDVGANVKASFGSDMELPYKGYGYEKVMLNTFLALNYLFLQDREAAAVEIRKAAMRQQEEQEKHEKELAKLEEQKKESNVDTGSVDSALGHYGFLDSYAEKVLNSFQNGFTYFLSGLVYELNHEDNDAYIDYKKSFNLFKNLVCLQKLSKLSERLAFSEEYAAWQTLGKEMGGPSADPEMVKNDCAYVTVVFFDGQVPKLQQQKFALWTPSKSFNVAWPCYMAADLNMGVSKMAIQVDQQLSLHTEMVLDMIPVISKCLKERVPGMVVRQLIRLVAKNMVEGQANKRLGLLGKWGAKLLNTVTERADLRGWYELPQNVQVATVPLTAGEHRLAFKIDDGGFSGFSLDECVVIPEKGHAFILVNSLAGKYSVHKVVL